MYNFEFISAGRIVFGAGAVSQVGLWAAEFGGRALVVRGRSDQRAAPLLASLADHSIQTVQFIVDREPTIGLVRQGTQLAAREGCDFIIGFGGGSALDAGKAIAALAANPGDPLDYLEVIGKGEKLSNPSLPCIAVPTTAGTGTEVTKNAVLASLEHHVKVSLRSPSMLPRLAVVDPDLTLSVPPAITASTGMDALTQLIEPFVSKRANPLTDAICREGLKRAARSLRQAYLHGDDKDARRDMSTASLFGGLALANAALGAVHGFAGPFGGMFQAPHGAICARLLPLVMDCNVRILRESDPQSEALQRYEEIAQILTADRGAKAEDGVSWVEDLCAALNIPGLAGYGLAPKGFPFLIEKTMKASSTKGNPVLLAPEVMQTILTQAL
jgi:alcohol dehydrogenase class IV